MCIFCDMSMLHDLPAVCVCSVTQPCLTRCNPTDCNPLGSSVHEIFLARILKWVAISFSRESSRPRNGTVSPTPPALQADSSLLSYQGSPVYFLRGVKWFSYIILLNSSDKEWEYYGSYFIDTEIEAQRST